MIFSSNKSRLHEDKKCQATSRFELIWLAKVELSGKNWMRWLFRKKRQRLNQSLVDCLDCKYDYREVVVGLYKDRAEALRHQAEEDATIAGLHLG